MTDIVELEDWIEAAKYASNLSELSLMLGNVSAAVRQGEQSVELADRSGDAFQRMSKRTTLAAALHAAGKDRLAAKASAEAEDMQKEMQPEYPLLYSLAGYRYCDLLLERAEQSIARIREVRKRAETTLRYLGEFTNMGLLDFALNYLTLGRTWLLEGRMQEEAADSAFKKAEDHLDKSVSLLRQSGQQDDLPSGLLQRAALWRMREKYSKAEQDLHETEQIANRGSMLIWRIEAALERCRLALAQGDSSTARARLEEVRALIEQTKEPYKPHVPDWPGWDSPKYAGVFKAGEIVYYARRDGEVERLEQAIDGTGQG